MVNNLSQENLTISSYYTKFRIICDELINYKFIPSCSCGVCTCGSMAAHVEYQEEEYIMSFIMGLNESFASVRGHILMMKPLPSLTKVFSLITQEEKQKKIGSDSTVIEFAALLSSDSNSYVKNGNANWSNRKKERYVLFTLWVARSCGE